MSKKTSSRVRHSIKLRMARSTKTKLSVWWRTSECGKTRTPNWRQLSQKIRRLARIRWRRLRLLRKRTKSTKVNFSNSKNRRPNRCSKWKRRSTSSKGLWVHKSRLCHQFRLRKKNRNWDKSSRMSTSSRGKRWRKLRIRPKPYKIRLRSSSWNLKKKTPCWELPNSSYRRCSEISRPRN